MSDLGDARYISLTTFKQDGSGVATPVWITGSDGTYRFTTDARTWKARRLHNDPNVTAQESDVRGRVKPGAPLYTGTGVVKADAESVAAARRAVTEKYGWQFKAAQVVERVTGRLRREKREVVAIELILTADG